MAWPRRRSRPKAEPPQLFQDAYAAVNKLENAVVRTIPVPFTLEDLPRAFWPDDTVDKLTAAFPLVGSPLHRWYNDTLSGVLSYDCNMSVRLEEVGMLCPDERSACLRKTDVGDRILDTLLSIRNTVKTFDKVRRVLDFMNLKENHFTPGAARHYCPWVVGLLPENHEVHKVDGVKFTPPRAPLPLNLMREVGAIVATGHLAPEVSMAAYGAKFTLSFVNDAELHNRHSNTFIILE